MSHNKDLIWDLPVRIIHWILVLGMAAAYLTHSLGIEYYQYHVISGYVLLVACAFRILWGVFGTTHAKFVNFVRGPNETFRYARNLVRKRSGHHVGHNPLGAIMIIFLLSALILQAVSGLFTSDDIFNAGPLFNLVSDNLSEFFSSIHKNLFYWILGLSLVHIAAVLIHWIFKKENLIRAMITGKKNLPEDALPQVIHTSKLNLATLLLVLLIALLAALLYWAQQIQAESFY